MCVRPYIFMCIYSHSHQTHEGSSAGKRTGNIPAIIPIIPALRVPTGARRGSAAFPDASGVFVGPTLFGIQNPWEIRGLKSGSAGITRTLGDRTLPRACAASGS